MLWWQGSYTELCWLNVWLIKHYMGIKIAVTTGGREEGERIINKLVG